MKRSYIYIAAAAMAASLFSCSQLEELEKDQYIPAPGESVRLILNASKGETKSSADTKVYVGQTSNGKVRYYWNEEDQIGVIPFLDDAKPNYVTKEVQINPSNKNQAQFETYLQADGYKTAQPDLLIYYPYNSSMLEGTTGNSGEAYAKQGLTFRLPQQQEQYGYSRTYVGENASAVKEHPSVWAISTYGLAYDLAGSTQTTTNEGGQTVSNLQGEFELDHVNTYFQFNVYGTQSEGGKNYADGTWKVASINVEAGHCEAGTNTETGEPEYVLTDAINIAGTYKFSYTYNESDFNNVSGVTNNDKIKLTHVAKVNSVRVNMNNLADAPALGGTTETYVPTFVVINDSEIETNPNGNLNCLKVSVTCFKYDENDNIVGSDTRVRFYNISTIVGKDISGNYYTIDFEVCDPVESYTDLSVTNTSNCYIISAPGNYTFKANVAGNGKLPHGKAEGATSMGVDPKKLMQDGKKYQLDWLWASGLSFDNVKTGDMTDAEVVGKIINSVMLTGEDGEISIGLAAGSTMKTLSGNILLALYEENTDGTPGDIVWTWHLWLGQPGSNHYKFPATNRKWVFTNEDWYMMDRNLGAETAELGNPRSVGLFYQRSRKEPMIGFSDTQGSSNWTSNQITTYVNTKFGDRAVWRYGLGYSNYNTLKYPMAMITNIPYNETSDYYFAWSSSKGAEDENDVTNDTKSFLDPCPAGYRMPTVREWDHFKAEIYLWIDGVQASGAFGYCQWQELLTREAQNNDSRVVDYRERIAAGDYYTVNTQYERTYHVTKHSGTGASIETSFPNTGVLRATDGQWKYLHDGTVTTTVVAGPEITARIESQSEETTTKTTITAPDFTATYSSNNSRISLSFKESGTYYYATSETGSKSQINNNRISNQYSNNITNTTYYIFKKVNDDYSNPTTLTFTGSNNRYTSIINKGADKEVTTTTTTTSNYTLIITFVNGEGRYGWATSQNGSYTWINGSTLSIPCSSLTFSYNSRTLYFKTQDASGNDTDVTSVRVSRSGNNSSSYTYSVGTPSQGTGSTTTTGTASTMALWSSGRVDGSSGYLTYWFGPAGDTGDGWGKQNSSGEWGYSGDGKAPFTESRYTYGMTYTPISIGRYTSTNTEYQAGGAVPMRCIREYDNTSTIVVAE